ncbi:ATP-binding protein [Kitasatospora viridis]|uniref:Anti-sigma regulatory factor (Ser/Thr protein kinase) n=1 Tax=Kitasatospora viridis TaxID=281105 RepID=A0A561TSM2_9ACTN|nr:ATP-binding protein [Kitasatospora viridis]TWF90087.1 anti-sigma regulatory factor (Ser/Thr protein kinase) [Kitasatospora viridis]
MDATATVGTFPTDTGPALTPPAAPPAWLLPHSPRSARTARRLAHAALRRWGTDADTVDQALLVVSELVTNAVEHALPPVTLRLSRHPHALHIEVADGGPAARDGAWTAGCMPEEHGRGLAIVTAIAREHGCRVRPGAGTHWADLCAA